MAMTLTAGREMRLDGAPDLLLPNEAEIIDSLAADLLANDTDGLYNGDRNLARLAAERRYREMVQQQQAQRAASEATAANRNADRNAQRAAVRGVEPESLPADEYGGVSRQTVREANRPRQDAEAALMQDQDLADQITGGLRTGNLNWQAEADRQYSQEHGLGGFEYGPGQTDLDIRRRIQDQQGFIRTQQGMIPAGRSPTPEQIENYRDFHFDWANETPGSERQARYNPEAHAEWQEARAQEIQDRAFQDMATYGTGPAWKLEEQANAPLEAPNASVAGFVAGLGTGSGPTVGGRFVSPSLANQELDRQRAQSQLEARAARAASEDREAEAAREVRIARLARKAGVSREEAREMMDKERAAMGPAAAGRPLTASERRRETQGLRDKAGTRRDAELTARQDALRSQRMLLAPGGRGMVNAINELPDEWRNIAILDRITQGRVGGPTPLGVDAVGAQNAMRFLNNEAIAGMDPMQRAAAQSRLDMQRRQNMPELAGQADIAAGNQQTPEAVAHLNSLAARFDDTPGGFSYQNENALAAELQKPPYNMPQAEAEATAYRLAEKRRWFSGGTPGGRPRAGAAPASPPPPPPGEGGPSGLDFSPGGGDMSF
jgi:hypothetical protein